MGHKLRINRWEQPTKLTNKRADDNPLA